MKRLFFAVLILGIVLFSGCNGNGRVNTLDLSDFIGDWYMSGLLVQNIDDRQFTEDVDAIIYFRDGKVTDNYGYTYSTHLFQNILTLSRDAGFTGRDQYCGDFEGGGEITFMFPTINPFFEQAYGGSVAGETAVFTEYCNYKTMLISGDVYLSRV